MTEIALTPGSRAPRRRGDDTGTVAIMVALLLPMVLLGVGALAVDLGLMHVRQSAQRSTAEQAALAAARDLPDVAKARLTALRVICAPGNVVPGWPADVCDYDPVSPQSWIDLRDENEGRIVFYAADANHDGRYDDRTVGGVVDPVVTTETGRAVAVQVTMPRSTVDLGFAGFIGQPSTTSVGASATARIGTPLGTGMLPFAVLAQDIAADNRFCVRDPAAAVTDTGYPGARPTRRGRPSYPINAFQLVPGQVTIAAASLRGLPFNTPLKVYFGSTLLPGVIVASNPFTIDVQAPPMPAGTVSVWIESGSGSDLIVSGQASVFVSPTAMPPEPTGPCARPEAERGVLDVVRDDLPSEVLPENVRTGLVPSVHPYDAWSPVGEPLTGLATGFRCDEATTAEAASLVDSADTDRGLEGVNCVSTVMSGFSDDLTEGLLDSDSAAPGRLSALRACSGGTNGVAEGENVRGSYTLDATGLFTADSPLVTDATTPDALQAAIETPSETRPAPEPGWISPRIFSCPRLALVPVIDPGATVVEGSYPVTDLTYVWLDDGAGVVEAWNGDRAVAIQGHVIDPAWFMGPETFNPLDRERNVSGSTVVGDYLGDDLPKEAVMVAG